MRIELWPALLGGALIGLSSALFLLTLGRVAGVSGMLAGAVARALSLTDALGFRAWFLAGLLAGGALFAFVAPARFSMAGTGSLPVLAVAGLLIGFGTRIGNGCTSGHGICGLGRGSKRSLAATLTFMASAMLTVLVARHL